MSRHALALLPLRLKARGRPWAMAWARALLLLLTLAGWAPARAADPLPLPALTARVMDTAGVLPAERRLALEARLEAFEREAGPQIVILTVPTTAPEDLTDYTQRLGDAWKIGRKDVGDGLLIVVAVQDRRVRIATAKALEGAVPDLAARQIIRDQIGPAFKQGDYATGLDRALDALMARIRGESLPAPASGPPGRPDGGTGLDWESLGLLLFIGVPVVGGMLSAALGRKLGSGLTALGTGAAGAWLTGSVVLGVLAGAIALVMVGVMGVSGMSGHRGGALRPGRRSAWQPGASGSPPVVIWGGGGAGGGGFGGGGFSSGGGGDFGGGGASGDW